MRKITSFKTCILIIILMTGFINASAQLLVEDFNYSVGTVLTATATADPTSGWLSHSGNGTANIDVTSGLSFSGYAGSGIGGAANLDNNGQDINKPFTAQTSGVVYTAFIIQAAALNNSSYFLHLGPAVMGSTFFSRVWINATGTGVGFTNTSTAPTTFAAISAGIPTLIVLKHNFTTHTSKLFVLNSYASTEPATADITIAETITEIGSIGLRQYNAGQKIIVDGIRVGTSWSDACAAPGAPKVSTPTFSATPGNVITSQSVTLSTTTAGASIYYTTDGTTPDNLSNGTLYDGVTPLMVNSTETIKAIAYYNGMDASSVAVGVYTFPTEILTISALRAASQTGFYKVTGEAILTYQSTAGKVKYIQDATGGIVIYDGNSKITTAFTIGDGIKNIYCTLSMYNGMLELIPFSDPGVATSSANLVTPVIVTLANLANYPSQLVTVKNVTITGTGNFVASTAYVINDGTAGVLRTAYTDLPYFTSAVPTSAQDITGVVLNNSLTEVDLVPRTASDLVASTITGLNQVIPDARIYVSNGNVILTATVNQSIEIYNSVGQKLNYRLAVEGINRIPVNAKGVILVKIGNRVSKVIM